MGEWSYNIYARFDNTTNASQIERALKLAVMEANGFSKTEEKLFNKKVNIKFRLTSVNDIYFSGIGLKDKGNRILVNVLIIASIFVLFITMLNLLNFSLSEIPMRMRSINIRRVMGASARNLRLNLIAENTGFALIGLIIGILLIITFQHNEVCIKLVSGDIKFSSHVTLTAIMAVSILAIGALSAIIPAFYSTSFTPTVVLKGSFGLSSHGKKLRMAIMTVQFCVAFTLAIYRCNVQSIKLYFQ